MLREVLQLMDELRTDLEELLGDGDLVMSTVDVIATRLAELGYVKPVRCGECKLQHSPYCYHEGFDDKDYCSEGESCCGKRNR